MPLVLVISLLLYVRSLYIWCHCAEGKRSGKLFDIITRVFERLLRSRGQGLWNTFELGVLEWSSLSNILFIGSCTPVEQGCCLRLVQLCRDALLLAFLTAKNSAVEEQESALLTVQRDAFAAAAMGIGAIKL